MAQIQAPPHQAPVLVADADGKQQNTFTQPWAWFWISIEEALNGTFPIELKEGVPPVPQVGFTHIYGDEATHALMISQNGGPFVPLFAPGVADIEVIGATASGTVDLAKGNIQRLQLSGSQVTLSLPMVTNGSVYAGMRFILLADQDAIGGRPTPLFAPGYASDCATQVVAAGALARSAWLMFYDGAIWNLMHFRAPVATS